LLFKKREALDLRPQERVTESGGRRQGRRYGTVFNKGNEKGSRTSDIGSDVADGNYVEEREGEKDQFFRYLLET